MKSRILSALLIFALATPVFAQEAPVPRRMPRTPVNRESIQEQRRAAVPASREVQGQAVIIDGEKLRIGEIDMRLFGIVPPQLSASFGPQARSALDEMTASQVTTCTIRDRDREERFLATCHNANNADLALELLRRGLAVTARGSVASTDLAGTYVTAEQAAAAQKLGLWSVVIPAAATIPEAPKVEAASAASQTKKPEEKSTSVAAKTEQNQSITSPVMTSIKTVVPTVTLPETAVVVSSGGPGFFERYQLLVTGLVLLITALGLFGAIAIQRLRERRAEMQAIAAALRGELMAAHAVCRARLRSSVNIEDKDIAWPRLRSTLYQAYVGRIGWLGAELARRIASIYGQASDYAAYYVGDDETRAAAMPKRQALQALVQHIDDVLPRLAIIEHTGNPSSTGVKPPRPTAVVVPLTPAAPSQPNAQAAVVSATASQAAPEQAAVSASAMPPVQTTEAVPLAVALSAVTQIWTAIQKLARTPWEKKKEDPDRDPIAEYTALIEEEMKRFSFVEEEDESSEQPLPADPTATAWSPKAHEAL